MPDFDDIRRGLAANLAVLDDFQISPYLLDNPSPPSLQVAGVESIEYDLTFSRAGGDEHRFVIEACLPRILDVGAQKLLDSLLAATGPTSVKEALEADKQLTGRLLEDGTVQSGQPAAADYVRVTRYRGQSRFTLPNGVEVLLASWSVEVGT